MLVLSPDLASHFNVTLDLDRVVFDTEDREIVRGPYALTVRLGAQSDSPSVGIDVRADWLRPFRNVHLWGAFLNELSEYFGHAYLGGKLKIATGTLISGAYGFGVFECDALAAMEA